MDPCAGMVFGLCVGFCENKNGWLLHLEEFVDKRQLAEQSIDIPGDNGEGRIGRGWWVAGRG